MDAQSYLLHSYDKNLYGYIRHYLLSIHNLLRLLHYILLMSKTIRQLIVHHLPEQRQHGKFSNSNPCYNHPMTLL